MLEHIQGRVTRGLGEIARPIRVALARAWSSLRRLPDAHGIALRAAPSPNLAPAATASIQSGRKAL